MKTNKAAAAAPETHYKDMQNTSYQQINHHINDPVDLITADIESPQEAMPAGMFEVMSVNEMIRMTSHMKDPEDLFHKMIFEHETTCIFGNSNCGKSIFAVQVADHISRSRRVLYFDCELSNKQFQIRYTDRVHNDDGTETVSTYRFSNNFYRAIFSPEGISTSNYEETTFNEIERYALANKAEVIIIDNITYLCSSTEKTEDAGKLMIRLTSLKKKYGWTLIVIAHTPKRDPTLPITQDSMAGSKKISNFFDSIIAIGNSCRDERVRYIKQVKARSTEIIYGSENVAVYEIVKSCCYLHFEFNDYGVESEHLRQRKEGEIPQEVINILEMQNKGMSQGQIAKELGIAKSRVQRIEKKYAPMYTQLTQSLQPTQPVQLNHTEPSEPTESTLFHSTHTNAKQI